MTDKGLLDDYYRELKEESGGAVWLTRCELRKLLKMRLEKEDLIDIQQRVIGEIRVKYYLKDAIQKLIIDKPRTA